MALRWLTVALLILTSGVSAQDFGRRGRGDFGPRDRGDRSDRWRGGDDRSRGRFGDRGPGRGGFDPISRLDANRNGIIDQQEIDGIPERYRRIMKDRGFDIQSGESVDRLRDRVRERMSRDWRNRDRDREEPGDNGRANRSTPPPPFKPRDRERITVDLPENYVEADSDLDGQIGLYEWIVARRSDLELFDDIDSNSDGLLTPRELAAWDALKADAGKKTLTANKRERLVIVGTSTSGSGSDSTGDSSGRAEDKEEKKRLESRADWTFGRMDRDDDGTISMDEWSSSRRIRPWFEGAGIEIRPMSAKEFSATYLKLSGARGTKDRNR